MYEAVNVDVSREIKANGYLTDQVFRGGGQNFKPIDRQLLSPLRFCISSLKLETDRDVETYCCRVETQSTKANERLHLHSAVVLYKICSTL